MIDKRKAYRRVESVLPAAFKAITVQGGNTSFPCQAVDASAYGMGLTAEKRYLAHLSLRQTVVLDFGAFQVRGEVLNFNKDYGLNLFRFGVLLDSAGDLSAYQDLLN